VLKNRKLNKKVLFRVLVEIKGIVRAFDILFEIEYIS
jgi:hypothetical protein